VRPIFAVGFQPLFGDLTNLFQGAEQVRVEYFDSRACMAKQNLPLAKVVNKDTQPAVSAMIK
jgi:hypothetical protein